MESKLNPYQPPLEVSELPLPREQPTDDDGELGAILIIVKFLSIAIGAFMFVLMTIWWIVTLLAN